MGFLPVLSSTTTTVSTITTAAGSVFDAAIEWVGDVATAIVGQPLLMVFVCLPLVGLGVGLFRRLIHTRG